MDDADRYVWLISLKLNPGVIVPTANSGTPVVLPVQRTHRAPGSQGAATGRRRHALSAHVRWPLDTQGSTTLECFVRIILGGYSGSALASLPRGWKGIRDLPVSLCRLHKAHCQERQTGGCNR